MLQKRVIAIVLSGMICSSQAVAAEPHAYKLGVILPLTGGAADIGAACKNGMTMAYEGLSSDIQGRLDIIYEDDANAPKNTVIAFSRLTSISKVDVVTTLSSGTSKAVSPLAEKAKVPLVAVASDPKIVEGREHVVNFWVAPREEARVLIPEIVRRGYKKIARVTAVQDGVLSVRDAFDEFNKGIVKIVLDEEYQQDAKDFRPFLTKLKARSDVDAIFVNLYFGQPGLFAKQARELGITLPLFNAESFEDPVQLELSKGALVGGWYAQADDPGETFLTEYRSRFPKATIFSAGNCHDIVALLGDALSKGRAPGEINQYMHQVKDFTGVMGTFSATGDNRFSLPATLKEVTKTGFRELPSVADANLTRAKMKEGR